MDESEGVRGAKITIKGKVLLGLGATSGFRKYVSTSMTSPPQRKFVLDSGRTAFDLN